MALALLVLLTACSPSAIISTDPAATGACVDRLSSPTAVSGLIVEPDDGVEPLVRELRGASCAIDVSVYILTDQDIIASLVAAADRGVRVRVMLEEFPFGGGGAQVETREFLEDGGVEVRWSASDIRFSHAKYIVVDRRAALIMNQNLTASAFRDNREFAILTTDPASVEQAQGVFDRDWDHEPLDDPDGPLILSPGSRDRFIGLIDGASRSIDFYAEVVRDQKIMEALGAAESRGVAVRLIVHESIDEETQEVLITLHNLGVDIRIAGALYIHAKLMVIDDGLAVVGSQNFTPTSLDDNRELAIVVDEPYVLARCAATFERDWQRAAPGAPA